MIMGGTPPPVPGYDPTGSSSSSPSSGPAPAVPSTSSSAGGISAAGLTAAQRRVLGDQGVSFDPRSTSDAGKAASSVGSSAEAAKKSGTTAKSSGSSGGSSSSTDPNAQSTTTTNTNTTSSAQTSSALTNTSSTSYISYLDPASIQGAMSDAWMKKVGRAPTSAEMQAFLQTVYKYEDDANSGTFETGIILKTGQRFDTATNKVVDEKTGKPVADSEIIRSNVSTSDTTGTTASNTNKVSQRGLGASGLGFLADQSALQSPEEGTYQASTTYMNAMMSLLRGPGAGMS